MLSQIDLSAVLPIGLAEFSSTPKIREWKGDLSSKNRIDFPIDIMRLIVEYLEYVPGLSRVFELDELRDMREFTVYAKNKSRVRNIVVKKYQHIRKLSKFGKLKRIRFNFKTYWTIPEDFELKNSFRYDEKAIQKISEAECLLFNYEISSTEFTHLVSKFPMRTKSLSTIRTGCLKYFPELETLGTLIYNTDVLKTVKLPKLNLLELKLVNDKPDVRQILSDLSEISLEFKTRIIFRIGNNTNDAMVIIKSKDKLKWTLLHRTLRGKNFATVEYDSEGLSYIESGQAYFEGGTVRLKTTIFETGAFTISAGLEKQNKCLSVNKSGIVHYFSETDDEAFEKINRILS